MNRLYPHLNLTVSSHKFARRLPLVAVLALAVLALGVTAGCDSTSSETIAKVAPVPEPTPDPDPTVNTGQFIDSAVIDIGFRTATQDGKTNSNGEFTYLDDEIVTFYFGDVELPAAPAKPVMSPLDLVRAAFPSEDIDTSDHRVINIARLLQSLDEDGDPENGLKIADGAAIQAQSLSLDFTATAGNFETQVVNLVANSGSVTTVLISATDAQAHLEETLGIIPEDRDGDGVRDSEDAFPDDPAESLDTDGDGVGDNADYAPEDPAVSNICDAESGASNAEKNAAGCDNPSPVADAGFNQTTETNTDVLLDGSMSLDPAGESITYLWSVVSGPSGHTASFDNEQVVNPTFSVGNLAGLFVLELEVSDGVSTDSDQVAVTVTRPTQYLYEGVITSCTGICSIFTATGQTAAFGFDSAATGPGDVAAGDISNVDISLSTPSGGALAFVNGFALNSSLTIDGFNNLTGGTVTLQATGATTGIVAQAVINVSSGTWTAFVVETSGALTEIAGGTGSVTPPP